MIDFAKPARTKEEATAYVRALLTEKLPREMFEHFYIDKAGKPLEQIDAELRDVAREMVRLTKEQRCDGAKLSDAVCTALPLVFIDMVRERGAAMRPPGAARTDRRERSKTRAAESDAAPAGLIAATIIIVIIVVIITGVDQWPPAMLVIYEMLTVHPHIRVVVTAVAAYS